MLKGQSFKASLVKDLYVISLSQIILFFTGSVNVSAGSSSGVVGGLMTGEQYQFSVSITVCDGTGNIYTGAMSDLTDPFTFPGSSSGECMFMNFWETQSL